jgi:uncharacterized protein (TIGR02391 family)
MSRKSTQIAIRIIGGIMNRKALDSQHVKAVCEVLADTDRGLTKTELIQLLNLCEIDVADDGNSTNKYTYSIGLNKRSWLYKCFAEEINKNKSFKKVYLFIEKALNPLGYIDESKREKYSFLFEETNKALLLAGLSVTKEGSLTEVIRATTLDEVDRRVNHLRRQLYDRAIHHEVKKYCIKDYLRKDYYDAVFEASKGLAERVREITGLTTDGGALFQTAFSRNNPHLFFNALKTDSEISEFIGLKELLESIFHLVRNPAAHTPKINWKIEETKALDVLTLISFAHKYLDECNKVPKF